MFNQARWASTTAALSAQQGHGNQTCLECATRMWFHLKQVIITHHIAQLAVPGHVLSVCQDDKTLDCRQFVLQIGHESDKSLVQYDVLVLSMINNVVKLTLKQPATYGCLVPA